MEYKYGKIPSYMALSKYHFVPIEKIFQWIYPRNSPLELFSLFFYQSFFLDSQLSQALKKALAAGED